MRQVSAHENSAVHVVANGVARHGLCEPRLLLVDFIRHELGLTGTHVGCEHGVCGACTILLDGAPVRSCTLFAIQVDGSAIETVEGLSPTGALDPLQRAFRMHHGLQCGFCTPGFLIAAHALLRDTPDPTEDEIREYLAGNVCRCTGYQNIVHAIRAAASEMRDEARQSEPNSDHRRGGGDSIA